MSRVLWSVAHLSLPQDFESTAARLLDLDREREIHREPEDAKPRPEMGARRWNLELECLAHPAFLSAFHREETKCSEKLRKAAGSPADWRPGGNLA